MGLPVREGCTDGADISVAVCEAVDGSCGPFVVSFLLAWEEAAEEPNAVASAVPVCTWSAAKCARLVRWSVVEISVRSVRGLFVRHWGSAAGDICQRYLPLALLGCCRRQHAVPLVALLRAACGSGVGRPPSSWTPRRLRCLRGVLSGSFIRAALIAAVRPGVDKPPEWAPLLIEWGRHTGRLSVWALQVTGACYLPRGPWAVSYRWRWCPVALSGVDGPRGSGVRIVQIFCRIRASQMRRAALWCHRQCSWFTLSGVQAPMCAMRQLATHRHWLGCAMVGGRECCPSR